MIQYAKAAISLAFRKRKALNDPISVIVDTSNICNLNCIMCHRSMSFYKEPEKKFLKPDILERIYSQVKPMLLSFGGLIGEPLMNRDISKLVRTASNNDSKSLMTTNGHLLDEATANELIDSGIHLIKVSVDAATQETYQKIRQNENFNRVINNIKRFGDIEEKKRNQRNALRLEYVIQKENIDEIIPFIHMSKDIKVLNITFLPLNFIPAPDLKNSFHEDYDLEKIVNILKKADKISKAIGVFTNIPYLLKGVDEVDNLNNFVGNEFEHYSIFPWHKYSSAKRTICSLPWIELVIDLNGNVSVCCVPFTPGRMEKGLVIGNIIDNTLKEIWNGKKIQRLRKLCSSKENYKAFKLCRMCVNRPYIWGEIMKNRIFKK